MTRTYKQWARQVHELIKLLATHNSAAYKEDIILLHRFLYDDSLYSKNLSKYELAVVNAVRMQGIGYNLRQKIRMILHKVARTEHMTASLHSVKAVQFLELLEEAFLPKLPFNPHRWNKYVRFVQKLNKRDNAMYFDAARYSGHESPLRESSKVKVRIKNKVWESKRRKPCRPPKQIRYERKGDTKFYIQSLYSHLTEDEQDLVTAFQIDRQYQSYYNAELVRFHTADPHYSSTYGYHQYWRDKADHMFRTVPDPLPAFWRYKITQPEMKKRLSKLSNRDCIAY